MNDTTTDTLRLVIRRTYPADRARVWQAFTDPAEMKAWGAPEDMFVADFVADLRVGGAYRLTMQKKDGGEQYIAKGAYREITPQERIVYTWTWEEDTPEEEHETLVTWEFRESGAGTELTLTHENLASEESRVGHTGGWNQFLDKFGRYLAGEAV
jgi:uncharacterized protein YndB with AHSA1/START domain